MRSYRRVGRKQPQVVSFRVRNDFTILVFVTRKRRRFITYPCWAWRESRLGPKYPFFEPTPGVVTGGWLDNGPKRVQPYRTAGVEAFEGEAEIM